MENTTTTKSKNGLKSSIANLSFGLSKTTGTEEVPERAYKDGISLIASGGFVIFYGVEGKGMTLERARARLFQNADGCMDFTISQNWKDSPNILAKTGHLKGQQQSPKVPYTGSPPIAELARFFALLALILEYALIQAITASVAALL